MSQIDVYHYDENEFEDMHEIVRFSCEQFWFWLRDQWNLEMARCSYVSLSSFKL